MTVPDGFGLDQLNTASPGAAEEAFLACCSSPAWASEMVTGRPYADGAALLTAADRALERLDDAGLLEAMAGHPRIGERVTHAGGEWSRQEQSGMASADDRTTAELAEGNREYEARFGHVYLVSAAGRSGPGCSTCCAGAWATTRRPSSGSPAASWPPSTGTG